MKNYLIAILGLILIVSLFIAVRRGIIQYNSIVSIKNTQWQKVHVQVRKRSSNDAVSGKLIFDRSLTIGQSRTFTVENGDDILFRRDDDPNNADGIHFTNWTNADCDDSAGCIIDSL